MSPDSRSGQSIAEVLIAIVVGTIMLIGAVAVIAPALKSNSDVARNQVSIALGKGLIENVKVFSEANWQNIYKLATGSLTTYYLTTSSPFTSVTGTESIVVGTSTYIRNFYVGEVFRTSLGALTTTSTASSNLDPSTRKITVVYGFSGRATSSFSTYLTRFVNNILRQTDWSGGAGQDGPATTTNGKFSTSTSNINYSTTTGSIRLNI